MNKSKIKKQEPKSRLSKKKIRFSSLGLEGKFEELMQKYNKMHEIMNKMSKKSVSD